MGLLKMARSRRSAAISVFGALFALSTLAVAPAAAVQTGPLSCADGTVNAESRAWWTPKGVSIDDYRGVDVEVCVPLGRISGKYSTILHVQLRDNHATITSLRVQLAGAFGQKIAFEQKVSLKPGADGFGEWYIPVVLNTTVSGKDGWQEFRFTANIAKDEEGQRQYNSTGWQVYIANGKPVIKDYRKDPANYWETRSWYKATAYTNVRLLVRPPLTARSGVWTIPWACKPSGKPATYHALYVDANTHAIPMVFPHTYSAGPGGFSGSTSIDTTTLSNGAHKLLMRCDAKVASGTSSAVQQFLFTVDN